jgi:hypothetical protein
VIQSPDLTGLNHAEKDALILALLGQLAVAHEQTATPDARIAVSEAQLDHLTGPKGPQHPVPASEAKTAPGATSERHERAARAWRDAAS